MTTSTRLTDAAAIAYAEEHSLTLCSYADPTEDGREGVGISEARHIVREAGEVYVDVGSTPRTWGEYFDLRRQANRAEAAAGDVFRIAGERLKTARAINEELEKWSTAAALILPCTDRETEVEI